MRMYTASNTLCILAWRLQTGLSLKKLLIFVTAMFQIFGNQTGLILHTVKVKPGRWQLISLVSK